MSIFDKGRRFYIFALFVYLILSPWIQIYWLIEIWPADISQKSIDVSMTVFGFKMLQSAMSVDRLFMIIVLVSGGLGGALHAMRSFVYFLGKREFSASWTAWYFLRPLEGAVLALLFYLLLRGGLVQGNVGGQSVSVYGIAGAAVLVGYASEEAARKLTEIARTVFTATPREGGKPLPQIDKLEPAAAESGTSSVVLTVHGKSFAKETIVSLDGKQTETEFINRNEVRTKIPVGMLTKPAEIKITVQTPGAGTSKPKVFRVTQNAA